MFSEDFFQKIEYLNLQERWILIFTTIIVFYTLMQYSSHHLLSIIVILFGISGWINRKNFYHQYQKNDIDKILRKLHCFQFPYLTLDLDILNIYYRSLILQDVNATSFRDSLYHLNLFLKIFYYVYQKKQTANVSNQLENLMICRNNVLNTFSSIVVSLPSYQGINLKRPLANRISQNVEELQVLLERKIDLVNEMIEEQWNSNSPKSNDYTPHDPKSPQPNPTHQFNYSPHYNLF